jgi:hypothetical protein
VEGDEVAAQAAAGGGERLARWEGRLPRAYESGGAHLKKAYCSQSLRRQ